MPSGGGLGKPGGTSVLAFGGDADRFLECALQGGQPSGREGGMRADPAFVNLVNRQGVEVVPALSSAPFHDDEIGRFQNLQVLHHAAAVKLGEQRAELACGHGQIAQMIQKPASHR